jgi:hypothetical protein
VTICGKRELTRRLFYAGDAFDDKRGFEEHVGKSFIPRDSDTDPALANQVVAQLYNLHKQFSELAIIPAHGRSAYSRFFSAGPHNCFSGQ